MPELVNFSLLIKEAARLTLDTQQLVAQCRKHSPRFVDRAKEFLDASVEAVLKARTVGAVPIVTTLVGNNYQVMTANGSTFNFDLSNYDDGNHLARTIRRIDMDLVDEVVDPVYGNPNAFYLRAFEEHNAELLPASEIWGIYSSGNNENDTIISPHSRTSKEAGGDYFPIISPVDVMHYEGRKLADSFGLAYDRATICFFLEYITQELYEGISSVVISEEDSRFTVKINGEALHVPYEL